ncbi:hypothetical protein DDB_G0280169 [Dictyostelium discoideum AX4]|uniref:Uncharacterized protein n=1 Tax=Dictyostelium discoideum TaxID=44689 RepID=Q54VS3_DICDI|nr:hypothetical protein DDB_G0280169 [Dictyostelium discoideum AX4]EAL67311.1 hypothetical protein DDB_G0280169 [Dictyostelium discoideum AX4]|eukprot:XP_641282.1 hypothetical protein DDB_G0280169 [Dictyostelium discoideum AX4]
MFSKEEKENYKLTIFCGNYNIILCIIILSKIVLANAQSPPKNLNMRVTVYDQHFFYNNNFETVGVAYVTKGLTITMNIII